MDKLFYRVSEAGGLLSIGRTRVYELLASGELHSIKVGSSRLIPRDALVEYADRVSGESRPMDRVNAV